MVDTNRYTIQAIVEGEDDAISLARYLQASSGKKAYRRKVVFTDTWFVVVKDIPPRRLKRLTDLADDYGGSVRLRDEPVHGSADLDPTVEECLVQLGEASDRIQDAFDGPDATAASHADLDLAAATNQLLLEHYATETEDLPDAHGLAHKLEQSAETPEADPDLRRVLHLAGRIISHYAGPDSIEARAAAQAIDLVRDISVMMLNHVPIIPSEWIGGAPDDEDRLSYAEKCYTRTTEALDTSWDPSPADMNTAKAIVEVIHTHPSRWASYHEFPIVSATAWAILISSGILQERQALEDECDERLRNLVLSTYLAVNSAITNAPDRTPRISVETCEKAARISTSTAILLERISGER